MSLLTTINFIVLLTGVIIMVCSKVVARKGFDVTQGSFFIGMAITALGIGLIIVEFLHKVEV